MTQLIDPSDPRYFHQTSDEPYLRHDYKVVKSTGEYAITDNYEDVKRIWHEQNFFLDYVEVLDHKQPKKKNKKGF